MNHLSDIGIEKYGLRAFQRRIGRIHTISGHDFRRLYTSIQIRVKSVEPLTNPSFWLHFCAIYEVESQAGYPEMIHSPPFWCFCIYIWDFSSSKPF